MEWPFGFPVGSALARYSRAFLRILMHSVFLQIWVAEWQSGEQALSVLLFAVLEKQQEELQACVRRADEVVTQLHKTVLDSIGWAQTTVTQMQQRLSASDASSSTGK